MNTTVIRLILVGALVIGLLGATAIVAADTNETTNGDEEPGIKGQLGGHMSDYVSGDHHGDDHAEHHAEHAGHHVEHVGQHAEYHQVGGHC